MPQEAGTLNLIVKSGAAVMLERASDVVPVVHRMIEDSKHYAAMRAATITVAIPNATKRIVDEIISLIPESASTTAEPLVENAA